MKLFISSVVERRKYLETYPLGRKSLDTKPKINLLYSQSHKAYHIFSSSVYLWSFAKNGIPNKTFIKK